ncbi:MAG: hypothetical protein RLZZ26_603 [Candidatus Parcubacteria bacterium]|jgi:beta-lactamase superfamily II metal-dependent hydrolase
MRSFYWILFFVLIAANAYVFQALCAPPVLTVRVLDVGKGDAVLVQTPSGKTLLIDVGPDASILRALGTALPMWQRSIDAVVLSSAAHSSTGGLPDVQNRYHIKNLIRSDTTEEDLSLGGSTQAHILSSAKGNPILHISYGSAVIAISSSTPPGVYTSNGEVVTRN